MAKIQSYEEFVEALEQDELKKTSTALAEEEDEDDEEKDGEETDKEGDSEESDDDTDKELADLEKETEEEPAEEPEETEEEPAEEPEETEEEPAEEPEETEEEPAEEPVTVVDDIKDDEDPTVESISKNLYEKVKKEATAWNEDMHDEHTIESYLKENCAMHAGMMANALKELKGAKDDYTVEMYEAACETLKESFTKKIDEMKEAYAAEGPTM
jgi:hypothetical protein